MDSTASLRRRSGSANFKCSGFDYRLATFAGFIPPVGGGSLNDLRPSLKPVGLGGKTPYSFYLTYVLACSREHILLPVGMDRSIRISMNNGASSVIYHELQTL